MHNDWNNEIVISLRAPEMKGTKIITAPFLKKWFRGGCNLYLPTCQVTIITGDSDLSCCHFNDLCRALVTPLICWQKTIDSNVLTALSDSLVSLKAWYVTVSSSLAVVMLTVTLLMKAPLSSHSWELFTWMTVWAPPQWMLAILYLYTPIARRIWPQWLASSNLPDHTPVRPAGDGKCQTRNFFFFNMWMA